MKCSNDTQFYTYFQENMKLMHLPAPDTLFGSLTAATSTIKSLAEFVEKYGTNVTVREFLIAGPLASVGAAMVKEIALTVGAVSAAFYLGACIGSLIVATENYSKCHLVPRTQYYKTYLRTTGSKVLPAWFLQYNFENRALISVGSLA